MEVIIFNDYDELSSYSADIVATQVRRKPNSVIGLATGGTPIGVYRRLAEMYREGRVDFAKTTAFLLDEYLGIANNHPERYFNLLSEYFLNHVNISRDRIYAPTNILEGAAEHCRWYEAEIERHGGIDLQLVGIGVDGHIGFNEPGSSLASRTRVKTIDEATVEANSKFYASPEEVPKFAITMGVGTILEARHVVVIANGRKKAKICKSFIEGPVSAMVTASALQLHPHVTVLLDEEAASQLTLRSYFKWAWANKPSFL